MTIEVQFIASTKASLTMFRVNSLDFFTFSVVFLSCVVGTGIVEGQIMTKGGSWTSIWKKLNGARLAFPDSDRDETKAMGRGTIAEVIIL
jgi:hypothetical protein